MISTARIAQFLEKNGVPAPLTIVCGPSPGDDNRARYLPCRAAEIEITAVHPVKFGARRN
jgi:hypothetical protein